jgi:hypothetical protein
MYNFMFLTDSNIESHLSDLTVEATAMARILVLAAVAAEKIV